MVYRLPELLKAIQAGKPVYIVEGEKDADNLFKLGCTATTNAMGAGKWQDEYGKSFEGAGKIFIMPDNDDVGREHARIVAQNVKPYAQEVKILDLSKVYPALPPKGDVTDFYKALGKNEADALLERLKSETSVYDGDSRTEYEKAVQRINDVGGYCVDAGRICQGSPDGAKPLGDFIAIPRAVITCDDGVNVSMEMVIDGWRSDGAVLPRVRVPASQYSSMSWVQERWGFDANIMPGNAARDRLRYVIGAVGRNSAEKITEYNHTGWRKIDGKWAFLYQGGAIGLENITVNLGSGVNGYRLDGNGAEGFNEIPYAEAAMYTTEFRDVMSDRIRIPLLGTIFLAPLREFLDQTGVGPAYSLFLVGGTGARKSTIAALALSHFGSFTAKQMPASFNDTANFIRKKAFILKDVPIVVDDYHPTTSLQERKEMERTAQTLSRAFGDGADRGRLNSAMSMQGAMPPRGVSIISGEDLPGITQSGLSRYFVVNVNKGDVKVNDELTELQELARAGKLQRCMYGYIQWLLKQVDELPGMLHDLFLEGRVKAGKMTTGQHGRSPEMIAHIMIGYQMMLLYMRDVGLYAVDQCRSESDHAWEVLVENSQQQASDMHDERPSSMFISAISELLTTHVATVQNLDDRESIPMNMIGYCDRRFYYLMPNVAYRAVCKLYADQGRTFPLTMKMLYKQLREDGVIEVGNMDSSVATKTKRINGKVQRLLWIPAEKINNDASADQQISMDGFVETKEELPEGFEE